MLEAPAIGLERVPAPVRGLLVDVDEQARLACSSLGAVVSGTPGAMGELEACADGHARLCACAAVWLQGSWRLGDERASLVARMSASRRCVEAIVDVARAWHAKPAAPLAAAVLAARDHARVCVPLATAPERLAGCHERRDELRFYARKGRRWALGSQDEPRVGLEALELLRALDRLTDRCGQACRQAERS